MSKRPRLYTPEEGNALIPVFARTLPELRRLRDVILKERDRYDVEEITSHGLEGHNAKLARVALDSIHSKIEKLEKEFEKHLKVFDDHECELKGLDPGLIDLYSERDGQIVFLCWQEGEPEIAWWHDVQSGFKGRQPL